MKLSAREECFLLHWIYDEVHYQEGIGSAKQLQIQHRTIPGDLAVVIAAAIPDPAEQQAAANGPPPADPPRWPWTTESLRSRLMEARAALAETPRGRS
jgi:hypothetical protein